MAYEVYKRTTVRVASTTVSLLPEGRIGLNAAAARILVEAGVKAVVLLWDQSGNKIALKAAPRSDKNTYAVSLAPDKHSGSLRAKSFLNHIGWNNTRRERLAAAWNEEEKMFEVALPSQYLGSSKFAEAKRKAKTGA